MNLKLEQSIENVDWYHFSTTQHLPKLYVFTATIPLLTTVAAVNLQLSPALSYTFGKVLMLLIPMFYVKVNKVSFKLQLKPALFSALCLCTAPLLFLSFGFLNNIDAKPLTEKLFSLGLENHFFLVVLALSFINAPLEEWFYRFYLIDCTKGSDHKKAIVNALLFMPHHFAILIVYFPLTYALLFTFGTGVAAYVWAQMRLKGVNFIALSISHTICDIIVIGIPGYMLITKNVIQ
jgi:hypothetical protein